MAKETFREVVQCPQCKRRIFDRLTPTQGIIEIKCKCKYKGPVDLSKKTNPKTNNHNNSKTA